MTQTGPANRLKTPGNTTLEELLLVTAPPRADTTGFHLTTAGPAQYVLTIQGPEARWLTARILQFVEALHDQVQE